MMKQAMLASAFLVLWPVWPAQEAPRALPEPEVEGVFYVVNAASGALEPTEKLVAKTASGLMHGSARVVGDRAAMRFEASPTMEFRVKLKPGVKPGRYALYRFGTENGARAVSFARERGKVRWLQGEHLPFKAEPVGESYRITPVAPLGPGEYGFSMDRSNDAYLFGVDSPARAARPATRMPEVSSASSSSPAGERLKKLDDLLQKGLITKEDYEKKRAEIAPAAPGSEDRLRKLEDLYKKGLITKEDYEKKRAQIIADI
ncbi:MAG: SHOCT domain-containing protein [Acidobacteria bacterium]|nr:SHOCT domain-containing protein [Acidobacteriota bacterium]